MDNMAYLQQIASQPNSTTPKKNLMSGPLLKVLIGVGVLALLIIVIGTITSSSPTGDTERTLVEQVQLRSANLIKTIGTFNKKLKSSSLRSTGQSLSAVLTETNRDLANTLKSDYVLSEEDKESGNAASVSLKASEKDYIANVNTTLENARLNAKLDRIYANQMAFEISILSSLESSLIANTSNAPLKSALDKSIANLTPLHDAFDKFTDSNL